MDNWVSALKEIINDPNEEWIFRVHTAFHPKSGLVLWTANGWPFFNQYDCGFPDIPFWGRFFLHRLFVKRAKREAIKRLTGEIEVAMPVHFQRVKVLLEEIRDQKYLRNKDQVLVIAKETS